ncbi:acyl-CoA reductase family protein [Delftia acidovorans]|uniref:acyl-CoA reductase n=1 Tax=Delftia acidovorans TaxID=80866 RepID=UPI000507EAEA|nr:acyl-CoA reductase [Delftia acidovorans]KFJ08706.1 acyl-CoA reductase family protein [Delftia acidovorans]QQB48189.1 acyl-CoA reductase [Delftia acidovorans]
MNIERITAGYLPELPGLREAEVQWHVLPFERGGVRLEVSVPLLTGPQMHALAAHVRRAADRHLRAMPVAEIIDAIDRAIARLLDRSDPYRRQAETWLPVVSGYDADMVRLGLTGFFKTFRAAQLRRFVAEDFANPAVLDGFQPAPKGGAVRAFGPDLLMHSWAGNVPALSLWSLVCGLLVKAPAIGKLASAEPLFAGWFARLLAEVHPPLADCLAVVWWSGAGGVDGADGADGVDGGGAAALHAEADTVLAYGGNQTLQALRQRLPVTTRFLPHGHKLGFGMVGAQALDTLKAPAVARLAAWDVMRYDQQGCYSPHVFYVERGAPVSARAFADYLAAELANLQRRFARRPLELEEGAAVARWQQSVEWSGDAQQLLGPVDAPWSVAYSDSLQPLAPTALYRTIAVVGVDRLDDAVPVVAAQREYLQTAGIAASPEQLYRLAGLLGAAGVTRISAIGSMSMPEAGWHHDGRFNLLDLVRMTEIEQSAEAAAQPFAPYAD